MVSNITGRAPYNPCKFRDQLRLPHKHVALPIKTRQPEIVGFGNHLLCKSGDRRGAR